MALIFPNNPTLDQLYQSGSSATYKWNGSFWVISAPTQTGLTVVTASYSERVANIQSLPPTTGTGSFWYDIDTGNSYIKYDTNWVPVQSNTVNATSASFANTASFAATASFATTSTTSSFVTGEPNGRSSNFISARVNAGFEVRLDNLKVRIPTSGNRGLAIGAVSTSFTADLNGWYGSGNLVAGGSSDNLTYTTTFSTSLFNWNFVAAGAGAQYNIHDLTNGRFYRVTMMIGVGYINNMISIERLF
jgi:hypothetical protein